MNIPFLRPSPDLQAHHRLLHRSHHYSQADTPSAQSLDGSNVAFPVMTGGGARHQLQQGKKGV